jgi:hypothetical protein
LNHIRFVYYFCFSFTGKSRVNGVTTAPPRFGDLLTSRSASLHVVAFTIASAPVVAAFAPLFQIAAAIVD